MIEMLLTADEQALAQWAAGLRDSRAKQTGAIPRAGRGVSGSTLDDNVIGFAGELAAARYLDLCPRFCDWRAEKEAGGYDLSHRINVRAAQKRFGLLVRPGDGDDGRFVAAVVGYRRVKLLGWLTGADAKAEQWLAAPNGRPPCYLVPEAELRGMAELRSLVIFEQIGEVAPF